MASHLDRKVLNFSNWLAECADKYGNEDIAQKVDDVMSNHFGDAEKRMMFIRIALPALVSNEHLPFRELSDKTRNWFNHCTIEEVAEETRELIKSYIERVEKLKTFLENIISTDEGTEKIKAVSQDLIKFGGYMELFLGK